MGSPERRLRDPLDNSPRDSSGDSELERDRKHRENLRAIHENTRVTEQLRGDVQRLGDVIAERLKSLERRTDDNKHELEDKIDGVKESVAQAVEQVRKEHEDDKADHEKDHAAEKEAHMGAQGVHQALATQRSEDITRTYLIVTLLVGLVGSAVTLFAWFVR